MDTPLLGPIAWRELWNERLTADSRRRIGRAVRRGAAISEPDEAAIAAEYAIRRLRSLRFQIVVQTVLGLAMLGGVLVMKPSDPVSLYWVLLGQWSLMVLGWAVFGLWQGRRVARAYRLNRRVSTSEGGLAAG